MNEKGLVELFKKNSDNSKIFELLHTEKAPNPKIQHMDVEFLYNDFYIRGEAKYTDDTRQKSQSAIKVFGAILKGRNMPLANPKKSEDKEIKYALIFHKNHREQYRKRFLEISLIDLLLFGRNFELNFVFLVSDSKIEVEKWSDFLK